MMQQDQQVSQDQQEAETMLKEFYELVNNLRATQKKKPLSRDCLGEFAAQELLQSSVSQQDNMFTQIVQQKYGVSSNGLLDYLCYEHHQMPQGYAHTPKEISQAYKRAVDDMVQVAFKQKLMLGNLYTHVSLAFTQEGQRGEIFKISALASKKSVSIEGMIYCSKHSDAGFALGGKVMDMAKKPAYLIINRGCPSETVLGPNRIAYDVSSGEFRVEIPENYVNGPPLRQVLIDQSSQGNSNSLDLLVSNSSDNQIVYGQGYDCQPGSVNFTLYDIGISEVLKDLSTIHQSTNGLSFIMKSPSLGLSQKASPLAQPLSRPPTSTFSRQPAHGASSSAASQPPGNQIGMTRSMQLRQQMALAKKGVQPTGAVNLASTSRQPNQFQPSATSRFSASNSQNQAQQMSFGGNTPSFNRSQTAGAFQGPPLASFSNQNVNPNSGNQPSFMAQAPNQNFFKSGSTPSRGNNPPPFNSNAAKPTAFSIPNTQTNGMSVNVPRSQNQNSSATFNSKFSQFGAPNSQPIQFQFSNPPTSQTQAPSFNFSQTTSSNFNPFSKPPAQQLNQPKVPSFQPFNSQPNQQAPQFNFQPANSNLPKFNLILGGSNQQSQPQFQVPQFQNNTMQTQQTPQFNFNQQPQMNFNLKQPNQTQPQFNFQPAQQQQTSNQPVFSSFQPSAQQQLQRPSFSQLSQQEQQQLREYLKSLEHKVDLQVLYTLNQMMLDDPCEFVKFMNSSCEEFAKQEILLNAKKHMEEKQAEDLIENDALAVFLLSIPKAHISKSEKYNRVMADMKEKKITSSEAVTQLIVRRKHMRREPHEDDQARLDRWFVFCLKNEEFKCRQAPFAENLRQLGEFFRDQNAYFYAMKVADGKPIVKLPQWVDRAALTNFIHYIFTGEIGQSNRYHHLSAEDIIHLLRLANYFTCESLQEALIGKILIPHMSDLSALMILSEFSEEAIQKYDHKKSCSGAWTILNLYCCFYLQMNLPSVLKTHRTDMNRYLKAAEIKKLVYGSLRHIVNDEKDLEAVLAFTADLWAGGSMPYLFKSVLRKNDSISAFDFQVYPDIDNLLAQCEPTQSYQCKLLSGETLKREQPAIAQLDVSAEIKGTLAKEQQAKNLLDLSSWTPLHNQCTETNKDLSSNLEQAFSVEYDFKDPKISMEMVNKEGSTFLSKTFDFGRRSWILKVDIDSEKNVSLWVIERGPRMRASDDMMRQTKLPYQYSGIFFQFEIQGLSLNHYTFPVFFCFAHGAHQVIGVRKIANLSQLKNPDMLKVLVFMKEEFLNSSLMHYFSLNFKPMLQRDLKRLHEPGLLSQPAPNDAIYDLLDLPFFSAYQLLSSDVIRVEDEDLILFYIDQLIKYQKHFYKPESTVLISNLLSYLVRYKFLSSNRIFQTLLSSHHLKASPIFQARAFKEIDQRINQGQKLQIISSKNKPKETIYIYQQRKFYSQEIYDQNGRKWVDNEAKNGGISGENGFCKELKQWFLKYNEEDVLRKKYEKYKELYFQAKCKLEEIKYRAPSPIPRLRDANMIVNNRRSFEKLRYMSPQRPLTSRNPRPQTQINSFNAFDQCDDQFRGRVANHSLDFSKLLENLDHSERKLNQRPPAYLQNHQQERPVVQAYCNRRLKKDEPGFFQNLINKLVN